MAARPMHDTKQILDQLIDYSSARPGPRGPLTAAAIRLSGLALVAEIACEALHRHRHRPPPDRRGAASAIPVGGALFPYSSNAEETKSMSLLLVRAVIMAEKAVGQVDVDDDGEILRRVNSLDLPAAKEFLFEEYSRPVDLEALAAAIDSEAHAAAVFVVSSLMVDPLSQAGREYLDSLAATLGLEPALVSEIHAAVHSEPEAA